VEKLRFQLWKCLEGTTFSFADSDRPMVSALALVGHVPTFACGRVEEKELGPLVLHGPDRKGEGPNGE
jgi:hypothetical protein